MTNIQDIQKLAIKKQVPVIKPGYTVRIHQKIKEGEKQRIQIFEGLVLSVNSGYGADKTFTVRKIVEGIGVEKIFPLYSPIIDKIEVKKTAKVRRSKLYYMRDRSGKSARLKESFVSEQEMEEAIEEAVVANKEAEGEESDQVSETPAEQPVEKAEKEEEAPKEKKVEQSQSEAEQPPNTEKEENGEKPEEVKEEKQEVESTKDETPEEDSKEA